MAKLHQLLTKENIVFVVCVAAMIASSVVVMKPLLTKVLGKAMAERPPIDFWSTYDWTSNGAIVFNNTIGDGELRIYGSRPSWDR